MLFRIISRRAAEFWWLRPAGPVPDETVTGLRRTLQRDSSSLETLTGEITHRRCSFMPLLLIKATARQWRTR